MKDVFWSIVAMIAIGLWCAGMIWNGIQKRKWRQEREDMARYIRARAKLRLVDKPYMLPKQNALSEVWGKWPGDETIDEILEALKQDHEIQIIKRPVEPEITPMCEYQCSQAERK